MTYNTAELETIGLCIALEAICDIVNHALLSISDIASSPGQVEVRFKSRVHQQIFLIRLLDFSKERGDKTLTGVTGSCLDVLKDACETRSFDSEGSIDLLVSARRVLDDWLSSKTSLCLWLPTLNLEAQLNVARIDLLYIIGNHVKHNLSRLTRLSRNIVQILKNNGHDVPIEQIPLALDDFREHLQEDYFVYYGAWLAELLNNVRWGLQEYLLPTFNSSYTRDPVDPKAYTYNFPDSVRNEVPRAWFWRLMNNIGTRPYLKRFSVPDYMKNDILR